MEKTVVIDPIASYIFSFLKSKDVTEYRIAKDCGFSHVVFSHWRKGKKPSGDILDKIQARYPDFDRNGGLKRGEYAEVPYSPAEQELEIIRLKKENERLRNEIIEIKDEKRKLFDLLGKHEGDTNSLLVDTEKGIETMNWVLYSISGIALKERMN